jgi:hypothetical protein
VQRAPFEARDPMETLIEDTSKQGIKERAEVSDFKGEFDPDLFIYWVREVEKYHEMVGIEKDGPKR